LRAATIALDDAQHALHRRAADTAGAAEAAEEVWVLDSRGTPLASVVEPLRYAINVTDDEDQHLERPIEGMIRIQADSPPRIAAAAITTVVLPSAAPTIYYRALDDHALGRIWLSYEITRSGKTEPGEPETTTGEVKIYDFAPGREEAQQNIDSHFGFDLAKLELGPAKLHKGDTITVVLHASGYRGGREPKSASSDPLLLHVTDEQGVRSSLLEADRQSARELKAMIERQLGIGGAQ
jgi:hypothetical protein